MGRPNFIWALELLHAKVLGFGRRDAGLITYTTIKHTESFRFRFVQRERIKYVLSPGKARMIINVLCSCFCSPLRGLTCPSQKRSFWLGTQYHHSNRVKIPTEGRGFWWVLFATLSGSLWLDNPLQARIPAEAAGVSLH